jgi:hypothetical protein
MALPDTTERPVESRSGLDPWNRADLPEPPPARGRELLRTIGPGAIILGSAIGSGEWLIGPAAFLKYGMALMWVAGLAAFFQTVLNTEVMRYTLYTGESAFVGFMRTRPRAGFWAAFYVLLCFVQNGWPGWAGAAAAAIYLLAMGTAAEHASSLHAIGSATLLAIVVILLFGGRRIERTLELLNWVLVIVILGTLFVLCLAFASPSHWLGALAGLFAFDTRAGHFVLIPEGADWFLIGAFAAYSGSGGVTNLAVSNWARDKGFGMGQVVGYIPAAVGGHKVRLAHTGSVFEVTAERLARWKGWWRIVQVDQWAVFYVGAILGMALPGILYSAVLEPGRDIRGVSASAELARGFAAIGWPGLMALVALMTVWIMFKTQLDIIEATVRTVTDILWSGDPNIRRWRGGDVRIVYYGVLALIAIWGLIGIRLTQPIILLQLGANIAGFAMVVSPLHILYVNMRLLPPALRPAPWRRVALVAMALFYGFFVYLWLMGGLVPDPARGFLFNVRKYLS